MNKLKKSVELTLVPALITRRDEKVIKKITPSKWMEKMEKIASDEGLCAIEDEVELYHRDRNRLLLTKVKLDEEEVSTLKKKVNENFSQMTVKDYKPGLSLLSDIDTFAGVYIYDFDLTWKGKVVDEETRENALNTISKCVDRIAQELPNYIIIKPSNRGGINVIVKSATDSFDDKEYLTYAMAIKKIIDSLPFTYKHLNIGKPDFADLSFLKNHRQLLSSNPIFTIVGETFSTWAWSKYQDYPMCYTECEWKELYKSFTDKEKNFINNELVQTRRIKELDKTPQALVVPKSCCIQPTRVSGKYDLNKSFQIPGVPFRGNELRYRIVKILTRKVQELGLEGLDVSRIIDENFVQSDEMIRQINSVKDYICPDNKVLERWVYKNILTPNTQSIPPTMLKTNEYLADYEESITKALYDKNVYLISPPGTGKTDLFKHLFKKLDKVLIVVHQKNILTSKFLSEDELAQKVISSENKEEILAAIRSKRTEAIPEKMICIWNTFSDILNAFGGNTSYLDQYFLLFDESHNFVSQNFRMETIFPICNYLSHRDKRCLLTTGTNLGESQVLNQEHCVTMSFDKEPQTKYAFYPLKIDGSAVDKQVARYAMQERIERDLITKNYNMALVYSNHEHSQWAQEWNGCVHVCRENKQDPTVHELLSKGHIGTGGCTRVVTTCYMSEGTDLTGYDKVLVVIPVDECVRKHEVEQIIHRFRDAKTVDVIICQWRDAYPDTGVYSDTEWNEMSKYLNDIRLGEHTRNCLINENLGMDYLNTAIALTMSQSKTLRELIVQYNIMARLPMTVCHVEEMKEFCEQYTVQDIEHITINEIGVVSNTPAIKVCPQLDTLIYENQELILDKLVNSPTPYNGLDEMECIIEELSEELSFDFSHNYGDMTCRLSLLLQAVHQFIYPDVITYFYDNGVFDWSQIKDFIRVIQQRDGLYINHYNSDCYATKKKEESQRKRIKAWNARLNIDIEQAGKSFVDIVLAYKNQSIMTLHTMGHKRLQRYLAKPETLLSENQKKKKMIFQGGMGKYKKVNSTPGKKCPPQQNKKVVLYPIVSVEPFQYDKTRGVTYNSLKECQEKTNFGRRILDKIKLDSNGQPQAFDMKKYPFVRVDL